MKIIDKVESKVKTAISKIEQLEMRVIELENQKKESEERLQSILEELGPVGEVSDGFAEDAQPTEVDEEEDDEQSGDEQVIVDEPEPDGNEYGVDAPYSN